MNNDFMQELKEKRIRYGVSQSRILKSEVYIENSVHNKQSMD